MTRRILIDEDEFEVAIGEGSHYRTVLVRESEEGRSARLMRDPRAAAHWTRALAADGIVEAQVGLGHLLLGGHGVERDPVAALRWFEIAARTGNADALNMVGRCHERGWGVAEDFPAAARWYRAAAEQDHAWGQYNLANLLIHGIGVAQDFLAALPLLVRSARAGNEKAMSMLGCYREDGLFGRRKLSSAGLWYRWAAERGCFRGQFHHARHLLAVGRTEDAVHWFEIAFSRAPDWFRVDAATSLLDHPLAAIQDIGRKAVGELRRGHSD